ncbi:patatin-like phospholipase family protein [Bacillota bacterium LX-D]|nr:patatin-like phospholipase family protein [Bacillota bacterium LX-D]
MKKPIVGLALGSGAAKGFAHLGVIKVLVKENIPINLITGSSIGSVFGALYAVGTDLFILEKLCASLQQNQLIDFSVSKLGFIKGNRIEALLRLLTKNKRFEDLEIPLYVTAVDIERREKVVLEKGSIAEALRASISIPGVFQPKYLFDKMLVDGGVLDRVPVKLAKSKGADFIIAVDLKNGGITKEFEPVKNTIDIILKSIDLLEKSNYDDLKEANILLEPKVAHIGPADFHKAAECIALGEEEARGVIPKIKDSLGII